MQSNSTLSADARQYPLIRKISCGDIISYGIVVVIGVTFYHLWMDTLEVHFFFMAAHQLVAG